MNPRSTLFAWLEQFRSRDKSKEATHYSLIGGKYTIPDEHHAQWLKRYAEHLNMCSEPVFFVERRTPVFRMHFDLDMIQLDVPKDDDIVRMINLFNGVFQRFYPDQPVDTRYLAIVLRSPTMVKATWDDEGKLSQPVNVLKTGFHVIWPFLLVNQEQALTMRQACVVEAVHMLPPRVDPANSYEDVIDECVLLENGLRMLGSDKAKNCELCKGKLKLESGDYCEVCKRGKVPEQRVYEVSFVVNESGEIDMDKTEALTMDDDRHASVRCSSIRSFAEATTPGYVKPPLTPACNVEALLKLRKKNGNKKGGAGNGKPESGIRWLGDATELELKSVVVKNMEEFLQQKMGFLEWKDIVIRRFMFSPSHGKYYIKVWGEGSHWCANVRRCHTSSTIYFTVERCGVVQRCFCKKKGMEVPCSSFRSTPVLLTKTLSSALFDDAAKDGPEDVMPVLVTPVQSTQPFVPVDTVAVPKKRAVDVASFAAQAAVVAPAALLKQQLAAQQAVLRLNYAIQKRENGGSKVKAVKGKKGAKPLATTAPGNLKSAVLLKLDEQRVQESCGAVSQMRQELADKGVLAPPAKKARKAATQKNT